MEKQVQENLRHELRVLLGKMDLRDDAKIDKCIDILGVEPDKTEPEIVITDQPKKRKKNSGDPE